MMTLEQVKLLLSLPPDEQRRRIATLSPEELLSLDGWFEFWAHKGQLAPGTEGWRVWLMMAGRGFGKTRAGAEWIHRLALSRSVRIALVGATIDEARSVMVEGVSGILRVAQLRRHRLKWEPSLGQIRWSSGSIAKLFSGDNADGLRGPEHHFAWCDELAKWRQAEDSWSNLQMGLRAGTRPRALVTTTPRSIPLLKHIETDPLTVLTGGRTKDNINLPDNFIDVMTAT